MKIQIVEANSKKPLANTKIQLQIQGQNSGTLSLTTDGNGNLMLDQKYANHKIMAQANGGQCQWTTATEGTVLACGSKQKSTETSRGDK